jgi:hypothetical protein
MASQQPEKVRSLDSSFNNGGLAQEERTAGKYERIRLASILGGTSIY